MTGPQHILAGRVLDGRYRLEAPIGGGGMGEVYRAQHLMMEQRVAIKLLRPALAEDPAAARRFAREARATFRIDHPHCVRVTDLGATDDGLLYLVMEYLDGRTLGQELHVDGPMAPHRVAHVARQVCAAMDHAHALGLVHRDLKPANIMLVRRGHDPDVVKVLDFGLAKLLTGPDGALSAAFSMTPLTREGMVFGTAEYMSPEQAMGEPISPRADIYSLGVVMYEMLTGSPPFSGDHIMAVLALQAREPPEPPSRRRPDLAIPAALERLVLACMAKQPEDRPRSASELDAMLAALEPMLAPREPGVARAIPAASSTVDLDAGAISAAATGSAAFMATQPAALLGPAPALPPSTTALTGAVRAKQSPGAAVAAAGDVRAAPNLKQPAARRGRVFVALIAVTLIAGGAVLTAIATSPDTRASAAQELEVTELTSETDAGPAAPSAALLPAEPPAADAGGSLPGPALTPTDDAASLPGPTPAAAPADRATAPVSRRPSRTSPRVRTHLAAAEQARRSGNLLKQMAEADSALRLEPASRDAAYLLGDALVHSDRSRGCAYLRRAFPHARARVSYRKAACDRTD